MRSRRIIAPAIARARAAGLDVSGPLPADTVFVPRHLDAYDAVLAMYHDQGLPVLKHAGFGHAVNVTLGLPIVRTSVDHGTALDLAGRGGADAGSLMAAIELAAELACRRLSGAPAKRRARRDPRAQAIRPAFPARPGDHRPHRRRGGSASPASRRGDRPGSGRADRRAAAAAAPARCDRDRPRPGQRAARAIRAAAGAACCTRAMRSTFDWAALARERGARLRLIGNLPYNISTPLLFRLLESSAAISDMHFMLQREVVDRIVAAPGSRVRTPDRDAGSAPRARARVGSRCRGLQARAESRLERGAAAGDRLAAPVVTAARSTPRSSPRPSASDARRCATRLQR